MPIHDWRHVKAGIFHHFHHAWIEEISRELNAGLLPEGYYALAEQHAAGFGPDILTLEHLPDDDLPAPVRTEATESFQGGAGLLVAPPKVQIRAETDLEFYRRKQSVVVVRHVSGDRMVAVVEIVSPGNKSGQKAFQLFLDKVGELLDRQIHLLLLDLLPPTPRDPAGIHAAVWEYLTGERFAPIEGQTAHPGRLRIGIERTGLRRTARRRRRTGGDAALCQAERLRAGPAGGDLPPRVCGFAPAVASRASIVIRQESWICNGAVHAAK